MDTSRTALVRAALRLAPLAPTIVALLGPAVPAARAQENPPVADNANLVDNANLDVLRPLRLQDALPVAQDVVVLETGVQFVDEHSDTNRYEVPFRLVWGAAPDLQIEAGTYVATDAHEIKGQERPGDVNLGLLYNFLKETDSQPALSGKVATNVPSGGDSNGFDYNVEGLVTKSFDKLRLHANAGISFLAGEATNDRSSRWNVIVGASHPLDMEGGQPTTLIADFYVEQSRQEHGDQLVGVEVGTRHQLDKRTVFDVGLGHDIDGPPDRDDLRLTLGISFGIGS